MEECVKCGREIAEDEYCFCDTCHRKLVAIAATARAWQKEILEHIVGVPYSDVKYRIKNLVEKIRDADLGGE